MPEITIKSFAKINLSLDVGSVRDGYHEVDMVMQQLAFHDDVNVSFEPDPGPEKRIRLKTSRRYLPNDERNLAWRAAALMDREYGDRISGGTIGIRITKRIPVSAGMAGGSGNGAAVLHALNVLWDLDLDLPTILRLSEELGSDVPFCAAGQAAGNHDLPERITKDPFAHPLARATGRGTKLEPYSGIRKPVVFAKPKGRVSTREVYQGIDSCRITSRPDNTRLIRAIRAGSDEMYRDFINVLEFYTLRAYPKVAVLKELMKDGPARMVLMTGSGPTVFGVYDSMDEAKADSERIRSAGYESYWTRTIR